MAAAQADVPTDVIVRVTRELAACKALNDVPEGVSRVQVYKFVSLNRRLTH